MTTIVECSVVAKCELGFVTIINETIDGIEEGDTVRDDVVGRRCCCPATQLETIPITSKIGKSPSIKLACLPLGLQV